MPSNKFWQLNITIITRDSTRATGSRENLQQKKLSSIQASEPCITEHQQFLHVSIFRLPSKITKTKNPSNSQPHILADDSNLKEVDVIKNLYPGITRKL